MQPPAEHVHWLFATGFLILGLCLLGEAIVGPDVWRTRAWRAYLWPGIAFTLGVLMFPVMTFFTNSTIHMLAHGAWAQALMFAGAAELGLVRGKLTSPWWRLAMAFAFLVSGTAFLVHEQNAWFFQRSSFLHHLMGWTLVIGAAVPLARCVRPRSTAFGGAFAATFLLIAVMLYCDRDLAPIFGHLSPLAGVQHR
ncbi:MAG: hypothetical protein E6G13_02670 [Actinobacteria bacterium]|nr:MAG: hypothetical protein E6G13_02670 [Actinomycetota bacterium]